MHSFNSPRPSHSTPSPPGSPLPNLCVDRRPPRRERTAPHCECSRVGTFLDARGCPRGCGDRRMAPWCCTRCGQVQWNQATPSPPRAQRARDFSYVEMHPPFSSLSRFSRIRLRARERRCDFSVAAFPLSNQCWFGYPSPKKSALNFEGGEEFSVQSLIQDIPCFEYPFAPLFNSAPSYDKRSYTVLITIFYNIIKHNYMYDKKYRK